MGLYLQESRLMLEEINKKFVEFTTLSLNWPEVKDLNGLEDAKTLFRLANTQFKRALEFYILDGFVTEHVTTKQAIS